MFLLLSALKTEIQPILDELDVAEKVNLRPAVIFRGNYFGKEIILSHTGVGVEKMARTAEFCIREYRPSACINFGFCGALTPNLSLGDIIVSKAIVYRTDEKTYDATFPFNGISLLFKTGSILTSDTVVSSPHEKAFLGTKFDAVAVDMESAGLALVATSANIPFTVIRSVLDPMDMHLPDFSALVSADGVTSPLQVVKLLASMAKNPREILSLPQLQHCATTARETLTAFINAFIKEIL